MIRKKSKVKIMKKIKKDPDLAELILETQTENCERTRDASSHVPQSDSILMCQTDISSDQFHSLSSYSLLNQSLDIEDCEKPYIGQDTETQNTQKTDEKP